MATYADRVWGETRTECYDRMRLESRRARPVATGDRVVSLEEAFSSVFEQQHSPTGTLHPTKAHRLRHIDMLCLQEHKLRGSRYHDLGRQIWRQAKFLGCEAAPGHNHTDGQEGAGKGGICMFLSPRIQHMIHSHGLVGVNLAQWVLRGYDGGDVAVLNTYAPHTAQERSQPWHKMLRLPQGCRWVPCGD